MNAYAEKTTRQPKATADNAAQTSLVNNRPEAQAMQSLQHTAGNSSQVKQLQAYQSMADQATVQRQANPSDSDKPIQLKTKIKHTTGTVEAKGENRVVGLEVVAELDPKDPIQGSATGVNSDWMKWIRARYPKANVVRGHLLNHDLGGFGIEENLYPISTLANADHSSRVEQNVKGELTKLDGEVSHKNEGYIYYNVAVNQIKSYEEAQFLCNWGVKKNGEDYKALGKETIDSKLKEDTGGFGGGKKGKQSPKLWQHGTSKGGTEVKAVKSKLSKAMKSGNIAFSDQVIAKGPVVNTGQDHIELLFDLVEDYGTLFILEILKEVAGEVDGTMLEETKEMIQILIDEDNWY